MAEKIKLLELDIDVNQLVKNTTDARNSVEKLKEELKLLKKEPKENANEITILNAQLKNSSAQLRENELILAKYTDTQNVNNLTVKEARNQLAAISVLWANEAKLNGENTEQAKKYAEAKLLLTERIKGEEAATGDNRRNVGNYTQSILDAGKSMGIFGGTFGNIIGSLEGMKGSLVAIRGGLAAASGGATGFAGAMNVVKVAVASTGIGLLVIGIGLLIAWLSKIDPVVDKVQQIFAGLGAAIDVVKTTILKFVDGIKSVGDLMSKLGSIISHPIESFKQLAGSMAEAGLAAAKLKEAQQDLADSMLIDSVNIAKLEAQYAKLVVQSKNRSLSEKERIELSKQAQKVDQEIFDIKSKSVEEEIKVAIEAIKLRANLNKEELKLLEEKGTSYAKYLLNKGRLDDKEVEDYAAAQIKLQDIIKESTTRQEKRQNDQDAAEDKRIAKAEAYRKKLEEDEKKRAELAKKKQEAIIQAMQEELDLQDAISGKDKNESELAKRYQLQIDLLNEQLAQKLISETKYQTDLIKIQDEFEKGVEERNLRISEDAQKHFDAELENFKKVQQDKIDAANEANDLLTSRREEDRLRLATDYENELEIRRLNGENELTLRLEQLDKERDIELQAAEKSGADKNKIYRKYELAKAAIAKEVQRAQLGSLADGLGQISELLGKNTAAGKAAGIAQATINTYLGVSQVLAAPPSGPEPLNTITKAIAIATTIGTGIANVANIVKVPTKFESGGKAATAGGNRHSSGGTKYYGEDGNVVELEQGENWYVLNRNASSAIGRLSDINQRYGGVSFHTANNSGFYEEGGLVGDGGLLQRSLTGGDIAGVVLQAVDTAFRNVTIVTKVTDVISETGKYNSLVDGANI